MFGMQVRFIAALGGALALLLVVAVVLVLRARRRRRAAAELAVEDDVYDDAATIWAGHDGTTIVVRRHGRPRPQGARPALTAVSGGALLPMTTPWEPPQTW